jgi:uncharacterized protein
VTIERATYVDSSALVKLATEEPESASLRRYLRRRKWLVTSALARTEVVRALTPLGDSIQRRGEEVLERCEIVRVSDRILKRAAILRPVELRTLGAIHLASAEALGADLGRLVTYDERMRVGAAEHGIPVTTPS